MKSSPVHSVSAGTALQRTPLTCSRRLTARLNKANGGWIGLLPSVTNLIRDDWKPGKLISELRYRDSLAGLLRESAPDARIETEYRHAGTTTDIYFKGQGIVSSGELFIQLKYNLRQKSEYDRLVGQIEQINPKNHQLILILCGDQHDESLLARLQERYNPDDWGPVRIMTK